MLWGASLPGGALGLYWPIGMVLSPALSIWFLTAGYRAWIWSEVAEKPGELRATPRYAASWAYPVAILIVGSAWIIDWPLWIRFEWGRSAFEHEVATIAGQIAAATPESATAPASDESFGRLYGSPAKRIGLYSVEGVSVIESDGQRRYYFNTGNAFVEGFGFMYCTSEPAMHARFGILRPPWYVYQRD